MASRLSELLFMSLMKFAQRYSSSDAYVCCNTNRREEMHKCPEFLYKSDGLYNSKPLIKDLFNRFNKVSLKFQID